VTWIERQDAGFPLWAVGYVDSHGAVHVEEGAIYHTPQQRLAGRPFRFNVWNQEFENRGNDPWLEKEDEMRVYDWLQDRGWLEKHPYLEGGQS